MNNSAELQLLPMIKFSFNTWPHQFLIASLLRCVSDFTADIFFVTKGELFSWTYLLKKILQRTKILISPVWNKILKIWDTLFELIQIDVQYSKNCFKIFIPHEARATLKRGNCKSHAPKLFALPATQCQCLFFAKMY